MADYIEREAVINWFAPWLGIGESWIEIHPVLDAVYALPAADVAPVVHGRWVGVHKGRGCCSNCHRLDGIDKLATYCRYCGATMDLKEEN